MDIDPLRENSVPRYAVESDDSDDESALNTAIPTVSVSYSGASGARRLTIVLGAVGVEWLSAVTASGPPKGSVSVDGLEIGRVYEPSKFHVLVSITHRLPALVTHEVSRQLLLLFSSDVRILDTYSVPSYISSSPISTLNPPVMFLRTAPKSAKIKASNRSAASSSLSSLTPFAPPNLIQSLPASLLSMLEAKHPGYSGLLILVPSRHIPPSLPRSVPQPHPPSTSEFWDDGVLKTANEALQGENSTSSSYSLSEVEKIPWNLTNMHRVHGARGSVFGRGDRRRGDVGDGGMYI